MACHEGGADSGHIFDYDFCLMRLYHAEERDKSNNTSE